MSELTLYYMPTCPFCRKVLHFLDTTGRRVARKDTAADPAVREELRRIGGKTQVPCLVIDGKALYESDDIIRWLDENLQPQEPS